MSYSFEGFNEGVLTFSCEDEIICPAPVKMSANAGVAACGQGEKFCGVALNCKNGDAGVCLTGAVTLPYSGTAPAAGYAKLAANGEGGVSASTGGREYLVLDTDTAAGTVTFIL
ncbi:MAG: hypothetical protein IJ050_04510 [Clostridia bacterium]|nr:hypothetical protein [Clostridia bacterium]MBR0121679.1 hypothetical protein [Clostridia bacterium]